MPLALRAFVDSSGGESLYGALFAMSALSLVPVFEQVGTPLELYNRPANVFVAGFIGSPRMNLLPGRIGAVSGELVEIQIDAGKTLSTSFDATPVTGATATVGVRPEHLVPVPVGSGVLTGEVQITEQLGGETYVYVLLEGGETVTVEIKGQAGIKAGDALDLDVEAGRFHLFGEDERLIAQSQRQPVRLGVDWAV